LLSVVVQPVELAHFAARATPHIAGKFDGDSPEPGQTHLMHSVVASRGPGASEMMFCQSPGRLSRNDEFVREVGRKDETPMAVIVILAGLVFAGAAVQRSVGLGFGLVVAPVLSILWPEIVPAAVLLLSVPLTIGMFWHDRRAVNLRELPPILAGKLLGTGIGAALLAAFASASLALIVGIMVVAAVALNLARPRVPQGRGWMAAAGVASGVMGTTAATGGPPLALAYQAAPGPELRGTLAVLFLVGNVMSLMSLAVIGRVDTLHLVVACGTLPLLAAGAWVGTRLAPKFDRGPLRHAVLVVAGLAGVVAMVRGIHILL
jgi:uncharacterized protein